MAVLSICALLPGGHGGGTAAQSSASPPQATAARASAAQDPLVAKAVIDPRLKTPFFRQLRLSLPWHMIEHEDGSLESTLGPITARDLVRIEKTADCISTHQGEHKMEFSSAIAGRDGVELTLEGGLPAYASSLTVRIAPTLRFEVAFAAAYPVPTGKLYWRITRKELRLQSPVMTPGSRLRGHIAVQFDEFERSQLDRSEINRRSYRVSGWFKPVIQAPEGDEKGASEPAPD